MKLKLALILSLLALPALAQQNTVTTYPAPVTVQATGTSITATNTFQSVFSALGNQFGGSSAIRKGCFVQMTRGNGSMFVFFGPVANATTPTAVLLNSPSNIKLNCADISPVAIPQDQISITGTAGDGFMAIQE